MTKIIRCIGILLSILSIPVMFFSNSDRIITLTENGDAREFTGWGTSAAWWAQMIDNETDARQIAETLFSKEKGLGITIYRYNIGGGEADNPASRIGDVSRRAESFYVYNEESGKYEYDFTRDANARRMLDLAIENGVTQVVLFCNSPHFSMTRSGHASGGLEQNVSNLPRENYAAYIDYVLTVADWFVSEGYPVSYISPINEPQWSWGGEWVGQEGCHYTVEEAVELLETFAVEMKKRNSPYGLSGIESGCMALDDLAWLDDYFASSVIDEYCGTYSAHGYWRDNWIDDKRKFGEYFETKYPEKSLEMSEWCELPCKIDARVNESALYMANVIMQDLTLLNVTSWQSWVAVNGTGYDENGAPISDGFIRANDSYDEFEINKRYYAFKQFSAFIEPGMKRMNVKNTYFGEDDIDWHVSAAAFTGNGKTTVVFVNNLDREIKTGIAGAGFGKAVYVTDETHNCEKVYEGNSPSVDLPAKSVVTVVFNGEAL